MSGPLAGRWPSAQAAMAGSLGPEIREKFQAALALSRVELHKNPEKEPYKSKYSARALLEEVRALLGPAPEDDDERAADDGPGDQALGAAEPREAEGPGEQRALRLAVIEFHLGVNHIDTEELSAGEEHLVRCLSLLRPFRLSLGCVSLYIQAQVRCRGGAHSASKMPLLAGVVLVGSVPSIAEPRAWNPSTWKAAAGELLRVPG